MIAVGVDACKGGWFATVLPPSGHAEGLFVKTLDELSRATQGADGYGIDIPIGLRREGQRRADVEARQFLGPRRNSVFFTPVREALVASSHREASAISKDLTGLGVSQQAFALAPRILEAERWSGLVPKPVWEVHPEVSFALMLGRPAAAPKTTWAGMSERLRALEAEGISLAAIDEAGRHARVDDVLDAAAAAWSTARLLRGDGICLPDPPEVEPQSGRPMAIWA